MEGVQRFSRLRVGVQSAGSDPKKKMKGRSLARHGVTSVPRYVSGGSRSTGRCPAPTPGPALFAFLAAARRSSWSLKLFETLQHADPVSLPQRYAVRAAAGSAAGGARYSRRAGGTAQSPVCLRRALRRLRDRAGLPPMGTDP